MSGLDNLNFMKLLTIFGLAILSLNIFASTITKEPDLLKEGEIVGYIPSDFFNILGVQLGRNTSLKDITNLLGESEIFDGEHTAQHICYQNNSEVIEFTVSSLGYFYKVLKINDYSRKTCPLLNQLMINKTGLAIGISKKDVISLLGVPIQDDASDYEYSYYIKEKPSDAVIANFKERHGVTEEIWMDVYSVVRLSFEKGKLSQYAFYTTETF